MLRFVLPLLLAIGLIWLLIAQAGLDPGSVGARLSDLGAWWLPIGIATALQLGLSAEKWLRALDALSDELDCRISFGAGFFYTALAAVATQFLTVFAASVAVRSLAIRINHKLGLARGAASSGFEQLFDVAVIAIIVFPTAALIAFDLGAGTWIALTAIAVLAGVIILGHMPRLVQGLRQVLSGRRIGRVLADPSVDRLSAPQLSRQFFFLSLARYAAIFGRVAIICFAAGFSVELSDLLAAFNAGQISQLAGVTPGNIGLFEWSWSGVLAYRDFPIAVALEMAIVTRLASFLSFVALTVMSALWLVAERGRSRRGLVQ